MKSRLTLAALGLAALSLGACATGEEVVERTMPVSVRYPITVEPRVAELRVAPDASAQGLGEADRARLAAFISEFAGNFDGKIAVATPDGTSNMRLAGKTATDVIRVLEGMGVPRNRIALGSYPAGGDPSGSVVVSYVRYVAAAPQCGDWSENLGYSPDNTKSPNFGCAYQRNLAAMIADPRDLLGPRAESMGDAERRATVLGKYRRGEPTQTTRSQDESGVVSSVGQ